MGAAGNHLNPINSHTSHLSTALLHSQVYQEKPPQAASKHFNNLSYKFSIPVSHIRTNENNTKYYVLNWTWLFCRELAKNQSLSINQLFLWSPTLMDACSSSCHLPLISIWEVSTRPLTALNTGHKQTLNNKKIVPNFSCSRFDRINSDRLRAI